MLSDRAAWMEVRIRSWQCRSVAHIVFLVVFLVGIKSSAGRSRFDTGSIDFGRVSRPYAHIENGERLGQTARSSSSARRLSEIPIPGEFWQDEYWNFPNSTFILLMPSPPLQSANELSFDGFSSCMDRQFSCFLPFCTLLATVSG